MIPAAGSSAVNLIPVRMGEMAVSRSPRDVLSVIGLGSCVALILIAPQKRSAGLAHIVLPEVKMAGGREVPPGKFADTAVSALVQAMRGFRVRSEDVYAILVGGATMFGHKPGSKLAGVGDRNAESTRAALAAEGIGIASEDIGGDSGRSVQVVVADLQVFVRSGTTEPFEMRGSAKPIAVKVPTVGADPSLEPFPGDIWTADPPDRQVAS